VPGGLAYWQVVETIETIGESSGANWLGADINEIVPDENNHVSEFTAAMLATKVVATHLASKLAAGESVERNQDERNQSGEVQL
jgi:arginase family enzyme